MLLTEGSDQIQRAPFVCGVNGLDLVRHPCRYACRHREDDGSNFGGNNPNIRCLVFEEITKERARLFCAWSFFVCELVQSNEGFFPLNPIAPTFLSNLFSNADF
jgi:hypothetical protein